MISGLTGFYFCPLDLAKRGNKLLRAFVPLWQLYFKNRIAFEK
jgi:hypothetical protein